MQVGKTVCTLGFPSYKGCFCLASYQDDAPHHRQRVCVCVLRQQKGTAMICIITGKEFVWRKEFEAISKNPQIIYFLFPDYECKCS